LAQASARELAGTERQAGANEHFLLHRLVEDWGYQQAIRPRLREWLIAETGLSELREDGIAAAETWIEPRLAAVLGDLAAFAGSWRIVPGSVRLPWGRTFEVDFDLEPIPGTTAQSEDSSSTPTAS
jgi:hypothetical protein